MAEGGFIRNATRAAGIIARGGIVPTEIIPARSMADAHATAALTRSNRAGGEVGADPSTATLFDDRSRTRALRSFSDVMDAVRWRVTEMTSGRFMQRRDYLEFFNGWTYACIEARAQGYAELTHRITARKGLLSDERVAVAPDHWLAKLIDRPSPMPWVTFKSILKMIEYWQSLAGAAYIWTPVAEGEQYPTSMWVVPPKYIKPIGGKDAKGKAVPFIGYEMKLPGMDRPLRLDPTRVIYLPLTGPTNDFHGSMMQGHSRIGRALEVIEVDRYILQYLRTYFAKNATPEFVVESDNQAEMYTADWEAFLQRWLQHHQTADPSVHVPMGFLPGGWKLREVNNTANKAALIDMAERNLNALIGVFKTPKGVLTGQYDTSAPAASFNALWYTFLKGTVSPLANENAAIFTRWAQLWDIAIEIDVEPVTWSDPEEVRKDEWHRVKMARATINKIREENGEDPLPPGQGGDVLLFGESLEPLALKEPVESKTVIPDYQTIAAANAIQAWAVAVQAGELAREAAIALCGDLFGIDVARASKYFPEPQKPASTASDEAGASTGGGGAFGAPQGQDDASGDGAEAGSDDAGGEAGGGDGSPQGSSGTPAQGGTVAPVAKQDAPQGGSGASGSPAATPADGSKL
jgi:hypothetical protein